MVKANLSTVLDGTRVVTRWPIGLVETIKAANHDRLARFYRANYRPDNATLVIVGNIDPATVEQKILSGFSDWKAAGTPDPIDLGTPSGKRHVGEFVAAGAPEPELFIATHGEGVLAFNGARFRQILPTDATLRNVTAVLGKFTDPGLPARDVDVALFHDVLHHIKDRAEYLKNTAQYVKAGGRIAIVELDPKTGSHRNEPELTVSKEQAKAWLAAVGFKPVQEFDGLTENKWFVVYSR